MSPGDQPSAVSYQAEEAWLVAGDASCGEQVAEVERMLYRFMQSLTFSG